MRPSFAGGAAWWSAAATETWQSLLRDLLSAADRISHHRSGAVAGRSTAALYIVVQRLFK
jgi:hypothetical protein